MDLFINSLSVPRKARNKRIYPNDSSSSGSSSASGSVDLTNLLKLAGMLEQTVEGDLILNGNFYCQGDVVAFSSVPGIATSWWDAMPMASPSVLGGIKIGNNLSIDVNGVLSAEAGGVSSWNDLADKPTLFSGSWNDLSNKPALFSGSWNDLTNKPTLFSGSYTDLSNVPTSFTPSAHSHSYSSLTGLPSLFSGNYNDLSNKPDLSGYASFSYVDTSIANLVGGAPAALNALNELASAMGNDPNFSTTMINLIGTKQDASTAWNTGNLNKYNVSFSGSEIYSYSWLRSVYSGTGWYNEANATGIYSDASGRVRVYNNGYFVVDNYVSATKYYLSNNWLVESDANGLRFIYNGALKARLKNNGFLQIADDIEAFSTFN